MSKVNKQKRGRAYAEGVKAHVCRAQSQVLKCANDAKDAETATLGMTNKLTFVEFEIAKHRTEIENLTAMLKELEPDMEKLKKSITIRSEVVRNLNGQIFEMGNVIGVTASKLGVDLSAVEPATEDADAPVAEVQEKSEAAQIEVTP